MSDILPSKILKSVLPFLMLPTIMVALYLLKVGQINSFTLINYEIVAFFGYIAAIGDLKTKHIPNSLILAMIAAWLCVTIFHMFINIHSAIPSLINSLLGMLVSGAMFLIVYFLSRKGLGGGDVKFMAIAGLYLGVSGSLTATFIGTTLAALVGFALVAFKKIGRKDTFPLAPFLYAGILVTILA